jgi:2-iminoacetate synthase ThiH
MFSLHVRAQPFRRVCPGPPTTSPQEWLMIIKWLLLIMVMFTTIMAKG